MHGYSRCLLFAVVSSHALTACSGEEAVSANSVAATAIRAVGAPTLTSFPMPNACDLVTAEQAEEVLAQAAGLMSDDPENCMWASMESPGRITMLMLQVSEAGDRAQAQILFEAIIGMTGGDASAASDASTLTANGQMLEGLADAAWISAVKVDLIGARQLHVRKGSRLLSLNVTGMASGNSDAQTALAQRLQTLAHSAVAKL